MIRQWLKGGAANVLHQTGMDRVMGSFSGSGKSPVVIGYHRVVQDFAESAKTSIPSLLVSTRMLERHLDWIGRRYTFVGLDELGERLESGEHPAKPLAAVTFDDGYRDVYDHAAPILQRKGIPAAAFVVTNLVSTARAHAHDRLYLLLARRVGRRKLESWNGIEVPNLDEMTAYQATRVLLEALPAAAIDQVIQALEAEESLPSDALDSFSSLNWDQLERLARAGFVIGSHTKSHILMTNEKATRVREELAESRQELEHRLGRTIRHFAYPSGLFNTSSVNEVAAAGYRFAYTGCTHRSVTHPLLTVPRTVLWENSSLDSARAFSGPVLSCQIHRAFDFVNGCRQLHTT